jgi:curved DNA-binding protein CbpA
VQRLIDAYATLQVHPRADPDVIQAAYRALARRYHPDGSEPNVERMAQINEAYGHLRDTEARRRYDRRRAPSRWEPVPMAMPPRTTDADRLHGTAVSGQVVLDFGRYQGWRVSDLARHDPDYLRWLSRHSSGIRFRHAIQNALPGEPDLVRRANSVA